MPSPRQLPQISIHLPSMLANAIGEAVLHVQADTLDQALLAFKKQHPRAAIHVFDDHGVQRRHVLIFLNDNDTRWLEDPKVRLTEADRLTVVQAVSGG